MDYKVINNIIFIIPETELDEQLIKKESNNKPLIESFFAEGIKDDSICLPNFYKNVLNFEQIKELEEIMTLRKQTIRDRKILSGEISPQEIREDFNKGLTI